MKLLNNEILVGVKIETEKVSEGGIIMPLNVATIYQPQAFAPTSGEVLDVSENVNGIQVGDTVFFHYNTLKNCEQQGRALKEDEIILQADRVIVILRNGELIPTDGWILATSAEPPQEKIGSIIVPEAYQKISDKKFKVVGVPSGYDDCKVGDIILTQPDCDRPIESNELTSILPKGLFKIETKDIDAIVEYN
jgi:co-chaperonin GroES (HSP10)